MLKTGEMLNPLNVFGDPLKKVLEAGENVKYVKCVKRFGRNQAGKDPNT